MTTAKPTFAKMGLKMNTEVKTIKIGEQEIEVKQYLPINEKLALIANVLNWSADENNFANPVKLEVFSALEIIYAYTNISFTDKQKEDPVKMYDILESNGVINEIISAIPSVEYQTLITGVEECAEAVYAYRNSVMGILDSISQDYSSLQLDAEQIQKSIGDPNNLALLKDVMTKLG